MDAGYNRIAIIAINRNNGWEIYHSELFHSEAVQAVAKKLGIVLDYEAEPGQEFGGYDYAVAEHNVDATGGETEVLYTACLPGNATPDETLIETRARLLAPIISTYVEECESVTPAEWDDDPLFEVNQKFLIALTTIPGYVG